MLVVVVGAKEWDLYAVRYGERERGKSLILHNHSKVHNIVLNVSNGVAWYYYVVFVCGDARESRHDGGLHDI